MSQGNPPPNPGQPQRIRRTASRQYENQPPAQDYQQNQYSDNVQPQNQNLQYYDHRKPYQPHNKEPKKISKKRKSKKPLILACISVTMIGIITVGIVLLIGAFGTPHKGTDRLNTVAEKIANNTTEFTKSVDSIKPKLGYLTASAMTIQEFEDRYNATTGSDAINFSPGGIYWTPEGTLFTVYNSEKVSSLLVATDEDYEQASLMLATAISIITYYSYEDSYAIVIDSLNQILETGKAFTMTDEYCFSGGIVDGCLTLSFVWD